MAVHTTSFATRRRLAALGALAAAITGVIALLRGIAESPFAIMIAILCLVGAFAFGWVALTRRGADRRRSAWIAVVLFAASLIAAVGAHSEGWVIVFGAISMAVSLPLGRYALGRDRRSLAELPPPGVAVPAASKPVLLVNPLSGDGKAQRLGLMTAARARGIECHEFGPGIDLRQLAADALAEGADVIGVAGGDGSQAIVADLVSRARAQMVCVPSGTRNHFAMDLGLDRADPLAALDAFGEARLKTVDLARVNGEAFLNNVSMGVYGAVVQSASYRERKVETTVDELPTLVENPPDLRFTGQDGQPHRTAHIVHVSNNPYLLDVRGAGGRPSLRTGELGIVTAELGSAAAVTEMFARAAVGLLNSASGFNSWTATRFEVDSDEPIAAGVDGEAVELTPPAVFTIEAEVLQVRIPSSAVGRSPAAFVPQVPHAVVELLRRAFLPADHWQPLPRS
ncbi:MAG: diacylglycerol kinase [Actinobacteria bacterium]|nr:diacylglycerol kinase [Actinomycetota bacterium]MCB8998238.1 diacylglycerol kinase [Actinomycetota bacterium]HRY08962.1 diacylglycerol kinase family protein [Candidatus Nanopelagicales bacterium]